MLVSKYWHALLLPRLYREVNLYRAGQIPALARSLLSASQTFGLLVNDLRMTCFLLDPSLSITIVHSRLKSLAHCTAPQRAASEQGLTCPKLFELLWELGRSLPLLGTANDTAGPLLVLPPSVTELVILTNGMRFGESGLLKSCLCL